MLKLRNLLVSALGILGFSLALIIYLLIKTAYLWAVISFGLLLLNFYWLKTLGFLAMSGDFVGNVDLSLVTKEWVDIPTETSHIYGLIYRAKRDENSKKPYIIVAHGAGGTAEDLDLIVVPLVLNGFHVLCFNQSGHGNPPHQSPGNKGQYPEVMVNIHPAVDFVLKQPDLISATPPRIGFVGVSTGGVMALTQAYLNPHIKVTIALSGVHDFMALVRAKFPRFSPSWWFKILLKLGGMDLEYTEEENRIISPKYCLESRPENRTRVFMIHTEDDVLPFSEAKLNQALAGVPDENCLFLTKGGHNFRGQETVVIAQVLAWFQKYL